MNRILNWTDIIDTQIYGMKLIQKGRHMQDVPPTKIHQLDNIKHQEQRLQLHHYILIKWSFNAYNIWKVIQY